MKILVFAQIVFRMALFFSGVGLYWRAFPSACSNGFEALREVIVMSALLCAAVVPWKKNPFGA